MKINESLLSFVEGLRQNVGNVANIALAELYLYYLLNDGDAVADSEMAVVRTMRVLADFNSRVSTTARYKTLIKDYSTLTNEEKIKRIDNIERKLRKIYQDNGIQVINDK